MVNSKRKGTRFEQELKKLLEDKFPGSKWFRVPMSGAIGTLTGESSLDGDLIGSVPGFPKRIKVEAKVGYSQSGKSMAIRKEWLDSIIEKSKKDMSFPVLMAKFEQARTGTRVFVALDLDSFVFLINLAKGGG